jgi:hypothetical protein
VNYELKLLDMDRPNRNDKRELHNGEIVPMYNNRTYTEALEKYASTLEKQLTSTDRELLKTTRERNAFNDGYSLGCETTRKKYEK